MKKTMIWVMCDDLVVTQFIATIEGGRILDIVEQGLQPTGSTIDKIRKELLGLAREDVRELTDLAHYYTKETFYNLILDEQQ